MSEPTVVNDENFEKVVLQAEKPVLVDFWAPWCVPCHAIAPVIKELANDYGDRVSFAKFNVDENPQMTTRYRILSIPTLIVLHKGKEIDRIIGAMPKRALQDKFKTSLAKCKG